jgi:hypothetical protein
MRCPSPARGPGLEAALLGMAPILLQIRARAARPASPSAVSLRPEGVVGVASRSAASE